MGKAWQYALCAPWLPEHSCTTSAYASATELHGCDLVKLFEGKMQTGKLVSLGNTVL